MFIAKAVVTIWCNRLFFHGIFRVKCNQKMQNLRLISWVSKLVLLNFGYGISLLHFHGYDNAMSYLVKFELCLDRLCSL